MDYQGHLIFLTCAKVLLEYLHNDFSIDEV